MDEDGGLKRYIGINSQGNLPRIFHGPPLNLFGFRFDGDRSGVAERIVSHHVV